MFILVVSKTNSDPLSSNPLSLLYLREMDEDIMEVGVDVQAMMVSVVAEVPLVKGGIL